MPRALGGFVAQGRGWGLLTLWPHLCFPFVAHPPPGDFIALGSKGQANDSKAAVTLLKPAPAGLPSERKREGSAALSSASSLTGLTKRPKLCSTPPLSALGRLAEAAVAEKRAISPSIKEPSVIPIEGKATFWFLLGSCVIVREGV